MSTLSSALTDPGGTGTAAATLPVPTPQPVPTATPVPAVAKTPAAPPTPSVVAGPSPAPPGPENATSLPLAPTGAGTRPLTWPGIAGGVTATVRGGDTAVDTAELDDLATSLTTAAGWLDDALAQVQVATVQVSAAVAPPEPTGPADGSRADLNRTPFSAWYDGDAALPAFGPAVGGTVTSSPGGASWTVLAPHSPGAAPAVSAALTFELLRSDALDALDALTVGPGSLADAATRLRDLATDLGTTSEVYAGAESAASQGWTTPAVLGLLSGVSGLVAARTSLDERAVAGVAAAEVLTLDGMFLPDEAADILHGLSGVLADENLADWARQDLLAIAVLGLWAQRACTGEEGETVQTYLAQTAARLDPEIRGHLPDRLPHGSGTIDTDELTPVQRVAAYLATTMAASGALRYGARTGVTVTPHGGAAVTVPRDAADPRGLRTAVGRAEPVGAAAVPVGAAGVIRASNALKHDDADPSTGVVGILRTDHADGHRSWTVLVPGTTDWDGGDSNPQDMLTNLEAVAGMPTDMESAVVTAMRQAGIAPGEEVALYGHSQGAITAANLASDPAVLDRYNVTTLLTAGGPVAGAAVPASVHALHLENAGDAVPGTDGADNPSSPTRMTVTLDTTEVGRSAYPHGALEYADAVDGLGGDPAVDAWNERLDAVTGAGEEGARTSELVFDVERETPETAWERTDDVVDRTVAAGWDGYEAVSGTVANTVEQGWDGYEKAVPAAAGVLDSGWAGYEALGRSASETTRETVRELAAQDDHGTGRAGGVPWRD